jgi:hypothetical protein
MQVTQSWMDSPHHVVSSGMPRGSPRLGRYSLMKLEYMNNGQESLYFLQVINERVKFLQQESSRSPNIKEKSYLEKV